MLPDICAAYDVVMKVLHIETGRHEYGGPRQVRYLLEGLAALGVDNVLVCPPEQPIAKAVPRARVITLPMRGDHDLTLVPRLARTIARESPDLVHVHSRRGADSFGGAGAALAGVPAVLTRRVDHVEPRLLARLKFRPYRAVVAISRAVEAALLRSGLQATRLERIPSAVDPRAFAPDPAARARLRARFGLERDSVVIGLVAQLIDRKGHADAIDAIARLVTRFPTVTLLCAGRGPLERTLETRITARGLSGRVRLVGFRADLPDWLPGLDVLVHPAHAEGLGVAVLEAMSAGVPVIAARAGGLVDLIRHGRDGWLVPPRDSAALADALETLLGNETTRCALARAGRARALASFSIEAMSAAYEALYARVLARGAAYA